MCWWWHIECPVHGCRRGLACYPQIIEPCASRCGQTNEPIFKKGWCETHEFANAVVGDLVRSGRVPANRPAVPPRRRTDDPDQLHPSSQQQLSGARTMLPSISAITGNTATSGGQRAFNSSFGPGAATLQRSSGSALPSFADKFGDIPKPGSAPKQASAATYPTSSGNRALVPAGGSVGGYQQPSFAQPPTSAQYSYLPLAPRDSNQQSQQSFSSAAQFSQISQVPQPPQAPPAPAALDKNILLPLQRNTGDEMRFNAWPSHFQPTFANYPRLHPLALDLESRGWYEPQIFQYLRSNPIQEGSEGPSRSAWYAWIRNHVDLHLWWLPLPFETFEEFEYRQRNDVRRFPPQLRNEVLWQQFLWREENDETLRARSPEGAAERNEKDKSKKGERGNGGGASGGGSGKGRSSYPGSQYGAAGPSRSW